MKHKVFISHSSKDKAIGEEVCRFLEANGISCWIAPRDVTPGKNYGAAIVDAIDECAVFVLILTSESNKSGQVVREVERAASSNSVIIPLRVEDVKPSRNLEFYISSSHWLDATDRPLAKHLSKLLEAIRNWDSGDEPTQVLRSIPVAPSISDRSSNRTLVILAAVIASVALVAVLFLFFRRTPSLATGPRSTSTPTGAVIAAPPVASPTLPPPASQAEVAASPSPLAISAPPVRPDAPIIQQVTASSVLAPETHRGELRHYEAKLAFDDDDTTAWVPVGNGVNQWITTKFKTPVSITSVSIYGGYGVDARRYDSNNRARAVRVSFRDGTSETLQLEDKMKLQRFELRRPVVTDSAKIEILAVYRGERHDETPISEIAFNRDAN